MDRIRKRGIFFVHYCLLKLFFKIHLSDILDRPYHTIWIDNFLYTDQFCGETFFDFLIVGIFDYFAEVSASFCDDFLGMTVPF
jgi:hypothetical protein